MMALVLLVLIACLAAVAFTLAGGDSSQAKALKRAQVLSPSTKLERTRRTAQDTVLNRRKQIVNNLKATERRQRKQSLSLESRLQQAGLPPNVRGFWLASAGASAVAC